MGRFHAKKSLGTSLATQTALQQQNTKTGMFRVQTIQRERMPSQGTLFYHWGTEAWQPGVVNLQAQYMVSLRFPLTITMFCSIVHPSMVDFQ